MHSGGSRLKNETPPITELSQERSSMQRPAFNDTVPTRLTKCGRLDSNWHWNPCSYPSSPESLPRLDYTPPLPRQAQLRREIIEVCQS